MHIEPGNTFTIEYGNGKTCEVRALSLREKIQLSQLMHSVQSGRSENAHEVFAKMGEALELVAPGKLDDPAIDEQHAGEIIGKALAGSSVSVDQQKKSE